MGRDGSRPFAFQCFGVRSASMRLAAPPSRLDQRVIQVRFEVGKEREWGVGRTGTRSGASTVALAQGPDPPSHEG